MIDHPIFEVVTTKMGVRSIKNKIVGETMHNPVGPWQEAHQLYIDPSQLNLKLQTADANPLVIYDVGLGAAANSLACLHAFRNGPRTRPLKIISFEIDLELLRFALLNAIEFVHFKGFENAVSALLSDGSWREPQLEWTLIEGDFVKNLDKTLPSPELIFYDPYSPQKNSDMWSLECFKKLNSKCTGDSTQLFTYSRATSVRAALLAAGFYVGHGIAIGAKEDTTVASTRYELLQKPLDEKWLETWGRSGRPFAEGLGEDIKTEITQVIQSHKQFLDPGKRP